MERENKYNEVLEHLTTPEGLSNEDAWTKLNKRLDTNTYETKVVPMWKKLMPFTAAAACLVLVFWFFSSEKTVTNFSEDTREKVELPDGSTVYLNKYSEITFAKAEWTDNRTVNLKGEAFFEVEKGSKFTVITNRGEIAVLGTSFNVFNRDTYFEVGCYTGRVSVTHGEDDVILNPGEATELLGDALARPTNFIGNTPDWKENKFNFIDETLDRVFEEVESEFGVVIVNNSGSEDIRVVMRGVDIVNLESIMQQICLSYSLIYEIKDDKVIVSKK